MKIRRAISDDFETLVTIEKHLDERELKRKIQNEEILICKIDDTVVGVLRFNKFWDLLPFINWMWVHTDYRKRGIGTALIEKLSEIATRNGAEAILTSTQSDEEAQHFYRKLGFEDMGGFVLKGEPLELIMVRYTKEYISRS